jgi:hypothetical protein
MNEHRLSGLAVVAVNVTPLVGVAFFEWSLAALVVIYWFELGVDLAFAAVRALFAQRPPEHPSDLLVLGAFRHKRGSVSIPSTDLRVQIANVPVVVVLVPIFGIAWFLTGGIALNGVDRALAGDPFGEQAASTATLGLFGIVAGRGVETVVDYFLDGQYRTASVQRALQSAVWPILVVGLAMVAGGAAAISGAPPTAVLVALVATKSAFDLVDVYSDRLVAFDERSSLEFGWASDPEKRSTVDTKLDDPVQVVRPRWPAVLVDGVVRGTLTPATVFAALVAVATVFLAVLGGGIDLLAFGSGFAIALAAVFVALGILDRAVRHLTMEYRVSGDVVGYDRLFDTPQWRVPAWKLDRCEPERTLADRLFGTRTFVVRHDDREIRLAHVREGAIPTAG